MDINFRQRLVSGALYGIFLILCTGPWLGEWSGIPQACFYLALITLFAGVGVWELQRMMHFSSFIWKIASWLLAGFVYYQYVQRFLSGIFDFSSKPAEFMAIALVIIAVISVFRFPEELRFDNARAIYTVVYIAIPFGMALLIPSRDLVYGYWGSEVLALFILIWCSDSFAYFVGKKYGKTRLAPAISPKKTWEGFFGGIFFSMLAGIVVEYFFSELRGNWIIIASLVAIFAPLGDLVESQIKRFHNVKDSSNLIPGHGGVLDRLDSFILCVPVLYLYYLLENRFF